MVLFSQVLKQLWGSASHQGTATFIAGVQCSQTLVIIAQHLRTCLCMASAVGRRVSVVCEGSCLVLSALIPLIFVFMVNQKWMLDALCDLYASLVAFRELV